MPRGETEHERLISQREGRVQVAHEMRERGHTVDEIARAVGVSPFTASNYLWENGGAQKGLPYLDVRKIRGTVPQYPGHRPAKELGLR